MPSFSTTRSITINAAPEKVHALLNDFHAWRGWSPWEEKDPHLERTYSGPDAGVGAKYAWRGNKQVGTGNMEITVSRPETIELKLDFVEPFAAENMTIFQITPVDGGTALDWTMTGERNLLFTILGKLFFDKAIAKDFDQGLAAIKQLAESAQK